MICGASTLVMFVRRKRCRGTNGVSQFLFSAEVPVGTTAPDTKVRWKSISGIGLALLLVYGVMNVVSAVVVPMALEARAVRGVGDGAVLIGAGPEEYLLG